MHRDPKAPPCGDDTTEWGGPAPAVPARLRRLFMDTMSSDLATLAPFPQWTGLPLLAMMPVVVLDEGGAGIAGRRTVCYDPELAEGEVSQDSLINQADIFLYEAKKLGRNRVNGELFHPSL